MSNSLMPFDFDGNPVRAILINDQAWLVAADVCRILGHTNTSVAMESVDIDDRRSFSRSEALNFGDLFPDKRVQSANMINESGLYALIFSSNLPSAKAFKRWVTSEVLPAIRRDGGYISPTATAEQLSAIAQRAATLAETQTRMLQAAQGLVDPKWLEAKTRHVIARGLGDQPEITPADRPLTTGEYLESKGVSGAALRSTSPAFGKAVKKEYRARHGVDPKTVERFVDGALRPVAGYTEADRPIFDAVWSRTRAVVS